MVLKPLKLLAKNLNLHKHNRLTSGELLSKDRQAVGFVKTQPLFREASFSLIERREVRVIDDNITPHNSR